MPFRGLVRRRAGDRSGPHSNRGTQVGEPNIRSEVGASGLSWRIFEMFARKALFSSIGRAAAMAAVAAMALTAVAPLPAFAGSAPAGTGLTAANATGGVTDVSARRRYYRGGGGAAAAGAFAAIVGTGVAIAATQNRRAYYDDYYGGGPAYYGGGPVYYGGGPGYYGGYGDNGYGASVPYFHGHPNAGW